MTPKHQTKTECLTCTTVCTLREIIQQQKEVVELLKEKKGFKQQHRKKYDLIFPN